MSKAILGLNPCISGLNYHDPAAAIVIDGRLLHAVEEERFNRLKGSPGLFPEQAVQSCLQKARITADDLDVVAIGYDPDLLWKRKRLEYDGAYANAEMDKPVASICGPALSSLKNSRQTSASETPYSLAQLQEQYAKPRNRLQMGARILAHLGARHHLPEIKFLEHHLCHAASAYYCTSFDRALVVVADGVGEISATTIFIAEKDEFRKVREIRMPNSLGYFYAAATAFLGFQPWRDEGKLMALAPYGEADEALQQRLTKIVRWREWQYDLGSFIRPLLCNGYMLDVPRAVARLEEALEIPRRAPDGEFYDYHKNFAYAVQDYLEHAVCSLVSTAISETGVDTVCAAGGVFLNCKMNMILREHPKVSAFEVQPVAKDSGLALGAALLAHECPRPRWDGFSLDLGPAFSQEDIESFLAYQGLDFEKPTDLEERVADLVSKGLVGFWFQGGAELGPRALGYRSIIADPRQREMADFINLQIKHREPWRPFAMSIMEDWANEILVDFPKGGKARYMIKAYRVRPEWVSRIPAVVHPADGTTRPHTVSQLIQPSFYQVISCFSARTGIPVLLNTSFNDRGEPLVRTPAEAVRMFFTSPAAFLVLEHALLIKPAVFKVRPL